MTTQTDLERVKMYWDFSKTLLTSLLVVIFAISGTAAVLMNSLAQNPTLWWTVYLWAPTFFVILIYGLAKVMAAFRKVIVKVDRYLRDVDDGKKIPNLQELVKMDKWGRWGSWLMGEQLEAPVQSSSSSRDENPEFDKEIELLKIQLLSNSAVSMTVSFTAIYLGGWISVAIVALQRIQDLVTLVGVLVITGVIVFRLLV
ncbi:MAG: hypothetical protein AUJ07_10860 [Crenarchaeota archaeon 13_1_40CM_3_53_5]|nr:MAG: hypothetical protein AUJ07_10860 [Crenarchaeota archaeon 13_1_40CM_3_53_5]